MAHPRIFVSSTYYDMKHIRSSLELFIDQMGFEPILSEKGHITYSPDIPLDESCYKELENADIFIMIIGGRYGSEKSGNDEKVNPKFYDQYDSISKQEYKSAVERDIPIYILIEKSVYSDYETFLQNKNNESINYAHVDSVNIFHLIDNILSQPRNNPLYQFDRYDDIEVWLKEQWSGLFQELLNHRSKQTQIASLASQVDTLEEINQTLKRYLEAVMSKISPEESEKLIENESKRLEESMQFKLLENNNLVKYVKADFNLSTKEFHNALIRSKSAEIFVDQLLVLNTEMRKKMQKVIRSSEKAKLDLNDARGIFGLPPYDYES